MPQQKQPITDKPKVEDESVGHGSDRHGKHKEQDEALPGKGSTKGGLNKQSGGETPGPGDESGRQDQST